MKQSSPTAAHDMPKSESGGHRVCLLLPVAWGQGSYALVLASLLLFVACSPRVDDGATKAFRIPWPDAQTGEYRLQDVKIDSFSQPSALQGQNVQVMVNPGAGSRAVGKGALAFANPVGRFVRTWEGVMLPADFVSLQATSVHAHFERLRKLDADAGIDEMTLEWPIRVALEANVVDKLTQTALRNNAIFDGKLDALLLVPYDHERLPIAFNAGILAHEHFHKIFYARVLKALESSGEGRHQSVDQSTGKSVVSGNCGWNPLVETEKDLAAPSEEVLSVKKSPLPKLSKNVRRKPTPDGDGPLAWETTSFLLRAMNEGFADYWGWVYSGESRYIGRSLPESEDERRKIDAQSVGFPSLEEIKSIVRVAKSFKNSSGDSTTASYRVGTEYARFLRELTLHLAPESEDSRGEDSREARLKTARLLIKGLSKLRDAALDARDKGRYLSPNTILFAMRGEFESPTVEICRLFERVSAKVEGEPDFRLDGCEGEP